MEGPSSCGSKKNTMSPSTGIGSPARKATSFLEEETRQRRFDMEDPEGAPEGKFSMVAWRAHAVEVRHGGL